MNKLDTKTRIKILQCLLEGNSIRGTSRIVGVSKTTILKLIKDAGDACKRRRRKLITNLKCESIQVDEMWSFVESKRTSFWTWIAICSDSKIIPTWHIGDRGSKSAEIFIKELSSVVPHNVQITSDGHKAYESAICKYMAQANFGMLVKHYIKNKNGGNLVIYRNGIQGNPDIDKISTSYIERYNLSLRMGNRRFARRTNAFSKKLENHAHSLEISMFYYNFIRKHSTLNTTPANKIGICEEKEIKHILEIIDACNQPKPSGHDRE